MSMEEVDAIFLPIEMRPRHDINSWGDLGMTGAWSNRDIQLWPQLSLRHLRLLQRKALYQGDFQE